MTDYIQYLDSATPTEVVPILSIISIEEELGMQMVSPGDPTFLNIIHEIYCSQDDIFDDF